MDESIAGLEAAVEQRMPGCRALVIGDLMLDRYLWGDVGRISPEAPVPVVRLRRQTETAGGAANVAANLMGLGVRVSVAGLVGADAAGMRLRDLLEERGIGTYGLMTVAERPTTTKTRILGGHQQMLRLDEEEVRPLEDVDGFVEYVLPHITAADIVVLSDYAKGVLGPECCRACIAAARGAGVPVVVDPKGADFAKYAGATAVTPNLSEMGRVVAGQPADLDGLLAAAAELREAWQIGAFVVTRGEAGISLVDSAGVRHAPAAAREVFDVSGAGDTVVAIVAAAVVAGLPWDETLRLANVAAGVVIGKVGTTPIQRDELLQALRVRRFAERAAKVYATTSLREQVARWRAQGDRIVFTNGCFDLLHVGHVTYLEQARRHGQRLIVGLNTDASVRRLKGPERPIVGQDDRARVLASLAAVDAVVLFDEDTPLALIQAVHPDVLIKGADYAEAEVVGAREVKAWGGEVVLLPLVDGRSTSRLVERILAEG